MFIIKLYLLLVFNLFPLSRDRISADDCVSSAFKSINEISQQGGDSGDWKTFELCIVDV